MTTSLYDLSVGSYIQSLKGVSTFMEKGAQHAAGHGLSLDELVDYKLRDDMLPFRFQLMAVKHQSVGALDALQSGEFGPPAKQDPLDYAGMQAMISEALVTLESVDAASINARAGESVTFRMGPVELPFTAENFILCFSLPNLYFHATTAYDILRIKGVPLSKTDFLGAMRMGA